MGKDAGYVYFEADCTWNGLNPFVPLDAENPTAAAFKQKPLKASNYENSTHHPTQLINAADN